MAQSTALKQKEQAKPDTDRLSFTLPREDAERIKRLAEQKNVTVAWVLREAVRNYLGDNPEQRSLLD